MFTSFTLNRMQWKRVDFDDVRFVLLDLLLLAVAIEKLNLECKGAVR